MGLRLPLHSCGTRRQISWRQSANAACVFRLKSEGPDTRHSARPSIPPAHARKWAKGVEASIQPGTFKEPEDITVTELLAQYRRSALPRERRRSRSLVKGFGSVYVSNLSVPMLKRFRDKRRAQGRAVQTVGHGLGLLTRAVEWARAVLRLRALE